MKPFEVFYLLCSPLLPPLYRHVRRDLCKILPRHTPVEILDVGGRKSHYTIGIPAQITVTDLHRTSDVQKRLHLGANDKLMKQLRTRRSNIKQALFDDMTETNLPEASFDIVTAVEVLEHVEQDAAFVQNVFRVLRPGGWFVMTTPNGDFCANTNPDHKRHYKRAQLETLLRSVFPTLNVRYAIRGGITRKWGLKSWSLRHPVNTLLSMGCNVANALQSAKPEVAEKSQGTHHLIAVCQKSPVTSEKIASTIPTEACHL